MNIIYIVQANSWNLNAGTPIIANQYALLAKNKNFNVCVLTPTNNKENFYKTLKKKRYFILFNTFNNRMEIKWLR